MKALFAGSFDPPTIGHIDIIKRAACLCEELYLAIPTDSTTKKMSPFTPEERRQLLEKAVKPLSGNIKIILFSGLVIECAQKMDISYLIRGLRNGTDFDYEYQMAALNRELSGIETLFLFSSPQYGHIHATLIREIAKHNHPIHGLVPVELEEEILQRYASLS